MKQHNELAFRKSSYSGGNGNCIEVASAGTSMFAVRDSKDKSGPILRFDVQDVQALVDAIKHDTL